MAISANRMQENLRAAAARLRLMRGARALLGGAGCSLLALAVCLVLDAQFHFGQAGRWTGFLLVIVPWVAAIAGVAWAYRQPVSVGSIARRIETRGKVAGNVLINAVQFDRALPADSALRTALFEEMPDPLPAVRWSEVFDLRLLRNIGLGVGAVTCAVAVWAMWRPAYFANSAARIFLPAGDIAPLTRTQMGAVAPGDVQVVHGSDVTVSARLGGEVPRSAWLHFREGVSGWQRVVMNRDMSQPVFTYHWKDLHQPVEYWVEAGDGRSALHRVRVRPRTAIRHRRAEVTWPSYTRRAPMVVENFPTLTDLVPGSRMTVWMEFTHPLTMLTARDEQDRKLPVQKTDDACWSVLAGVGADRSIRIEYRDADGFSDSETILVRVKPDEPPKVQVTEPAEGREVVARREAEVMVQFVCADNFGLGPVALYRATDEAEDGKLVHDWPEAAGQTSFAARTTVQLRALAGPSEERVTLYVVAKDQNDVSGPGVTFSRPVVIMLRGAEEVRQQQADAAAQLQQSLADLIAWQRVNLEESRELERSRKVEPAGLTTLLNRQIAIGELSVKLAVAADGLAPQVRDELRGLTQREMKEAVLALRSGCAAAPVQRSGFLARAIELEAVILAKLQGAPESVAVEAARGEVLDLLAGLENLLRRQRDLHRNTKDATESQAGPLARQQDGLADDGTKVRDDLARSARNAPLGDREFTERLNEAVKAFGEWQVYEDMLRAAEQLESRQLAEAERTQQGVIANLVKLVEMLNAWRLAHASKQIEQLRDSVEDLKKRLELLGTVQREIVEKSKDLAGKNEARPEDLATAKEIETSKDLMKDAVEQMLTDTHVFPDLKPANDLREELVSIFEDVIQADAQLVAEGKLQPREIAVQKEEWILEQIEKAQKIAEDMEMWLPNSNETEKWLLENFDVAEMPNIPNLPLPDAFEDLVGNLLKEQEGLNAEVADAASNQAFAMNPANGWDVREGPMPGFGAQGRSGNERPNKNEQTGRSSGGREGMSSGEMARDSSEVLEGSAPDARRTRDPMQAGQVRAEADQGHTRATGGGKVSGFSDRQGMEGSAPLRPTAAPRQLTADALAVEQALLAEKTAKTVAQASLLFLRTDGMSEVVRWMQDSQEALREGRLSDFNGLHRRIVQQLQAVQGRVTDADLMQVPAADATWATDKQVYGGDEGVVPSQYREVVVDYYRSLSEER